jgi:hypothetical protein
MLSAEPVTAANPGYLEIFQQGETYRGLQITDHQHPHDLLMQLSAAWRVPLGSRSGFTLAGGPAGEAALGPVAFMHRASAAEYPFAALSHHTFDSTHIAYGVATAAVDWGRWVVEGSVFNGREPDENRWDMDFGPLDSFSGRLWFNVNSEWTLQASSGRLKDPEQLEPGNIVRSTASISWTRKNGPDVSSVTAAYGRNDSDHGARNAVLVEAARKAGLNSLYGRFEAAHRAATDKGDREAAAAASREVRYWRVRRASAEVVKPPPAETRRPSA